MKVYLNTPLTCSHKRHVEGPRCPDCGTLERPRPVWLAPITAPSPLTEEDYDFAAEVEAETRARRVASGQGAD